MAAPLLAVFGIGQTELIILCVIILILFGHRLPSVMFSLGKGIKDFKHGLNTQEEEPEEPPTGKKIDEKKSAETVPADKDH
ncbi:twin arginine translocase protein A [Anatilimnocola aggregata]|uniref:Twin arginine translocase protein A n=1 Tax=Anatilimnocola aggregata TaxID=2528021 RepID=A0A517Y601_9BACT|nr:twin-arginine translocase TatA/TatE family subunit [Anatilimnocola aggregata]QDU25667.1 twin arginine translocase protein A [Anatilimnocola aggregata]